MTGRDTDANARENALQVQFTPSSHDRKVFAPGRASDAFNGFIEIAAISIGHGQ